MNGRYVVLPTYTLKTNGIDIASSYIVFYSYLHSGARPAVIQGVPDSVHKVVEKASGGDVFEKIGSMTII
jgi:hypothetical protein